MFVVCYMCIINNMLCIDMYISLFICIHSMEYYGHAKNNPHLSSFSNNPHLTSFSIAKYALFGKHEQVIHLLVWFMVVTLIGRVDQSTRGKVVSFLLEMGMMKP